MLTEQQLLSVRAGKLTFAAFARDSRDDFARLAGKVISGGARERGESALWLDVDDLVQEMLVSVPSSIEQWRVGDYSIKRFVVFRACSAARKLIKRARAYRALETSEARLSSVEHTRPDQHDRVERSEHIAAVMNELSDAPVKQVVFASLARTGSIEQSAHELMNHPDTRRMFLMTDAAARTKVRLVAAKIAVRVKAM